MSLSTKKIVYMALFISLGVVLQMVRIPVPFIALSFTGFPIIMAGIIFGPVFGGIVGMLTDLIGFMITPSGIFMPHFTLTAALTGIIPGLVICICSKNKSELKLWHYVISITIGQIITSVIMVPYFLYILFGYPFKVKVVESLISQLQHIPLYSIVIKTIIDRINQYNSRILASEQF